MRNNSLRDFSHLPGLKEKLKLCLQYMAKKVMYLELSGLVLAQHAASVCFFLFVSPLVSITKELSLLGLKALVS